MSLSLAGSNRMREYFNGLSGKKYFELVQRLCGYSTRRPQPTNFQLRQLGFDRIDLIARDLGSELAQGWRG